MPYPPRPPTGQAVAAALKRAGFNRSHAVPGTGRYRHDGRLVRGSERHSDGYVVKTEDGRIRVRHHLMAGPVNDDVITRRFLRLQRYSTALIQAGFQVRIDEPGAKITVFGRRR